eukprot:m.46415 g.46415  ORF g.46415 m.46415 type:complete len:844 (-) comp10371_c0_seq1:106-2637(-)
MSWLDSDNVWQDDMIADDFTEQLVNTPPESATDIKVLTFDPDLDPKRKLQKIITCHVSANAKGLQLSGLFFRLDKLCEVYNSAKDLADILKKIKEKLLSISHLPHHLCLCARGLSKCSVNNLPPYSREVLADFALKFIWHEPYEVAATWLTAVSDLIPSLEKTYLDRKVIPALDTVASMARHEKVRLAACQLCCVATEHANDDNKDIPLQCIKSLSQDVSVDVRTALCVHLEELIQNSNKNSMALISEQLFESLNELTHDEESVVRLHALSAMLYLYEHLNETSKTEFSKDLEKLFQSKSQENLMVAQLVGKVAWLARGVNKRLVFEFYRSTLSPKCTPETRRAAAYNFPALVATLNKMKSSSKKQNNLQDCSIIALDAMQTLSKDPDVDVRVTLAHGLFEVFQQQIPFSPSSAYYNALVTLLGDSSSKVVAAMSVKLAVTLEALHTMRKSPLPVDIINTLKVCEDKLKTNWRARVAILELFPTLSAWFPNASVFTKLAPRLTKIILANRNKPKAVQLAAVRSLVLLMRNTTSYDQRMHLHKWIIRELATGPCYWQRLLFIQTCDSIMDIFSRAYFKEYYFEWIVLTSKDTSHDVRLAFCRRVAALKHCLCLPLDRPLLRLLEASVSKISIDVSEPSLRSAAKEAVFALDAIDADSIWRTDNQCDTNDPKYKQELKDFSISSKVAARGSSERGRRISDLRDRSRGLSPLRANRGRASLEDISSSRARSKTSSPTLEPRRFSMMSSSEVRPHTMLLPTLASCSQKGESVSPKLSPSNSPKGSPKASPRLIRRVVSAEDGIARSEHDRKSPSRPYSGRSRLSVQKSSGHSILPPIGNAQREGKDL